MSTHLSTQTQNPYLQGIEDILQKQEAVRQLMSRALIADVDFGIIPGTGKRPSLLKPGAEKIRQLFGWRSINSTTIEEHGGGHRTYTTTCKIISRDGEIVGESSGTCSTLERKYRYRNAEEEPTEEKVDKAYWNEKDRNAYFLKHPQFRGMKPKKVDGVWFWAKASDQKIENPDPAEAWNTCLRMSEKRAEIAAVRNAAAVSGLFDELPDEPAHPATRETTRPSRASAATKEEPINITPQADNPDAKKIGEDRYAFIEGLLSQCGSAWLDAFVAYVGHTYPEFGEPIFGDPNYLAKFPPKTWKTIGTAMKDAAFSSTKEAGNDSNE